MDGLLNNSRNRSDRYNSVDSDREDDSDDIYGGLVAGGYESFLGGLNVDTDEESVLDDNDNNDEDEDKDDNGDKDEDEDEDNNNVEIVYEHEPNNNKNNKGKLVPNEDLISKDPDLEAENTSDDEVTTDEDTNDTNDTNEAEDKEETEEDVETSDVQVEDDTIEDVFGFGDSDLVENELDEDPDLTYIKKGGANKKSKSKHKSKPSPRSPKHKSKPSPRSPKHKSKPSPRSPKPSPRDKEPQLLNEPTDILEEIKQDVVEREDNIISSPHVIESTEVLLPDDNMLDIEDLEFKVPEENRQENIDDHSENIVMGFGESTLLDDYGNNVDTNIPNTTSVDVEFGETTMYDVEPLSPNYVDESVIEPVQATMIEPPQAELDIFTGGGAAIFGAALSSYEI
jgi:hypothetical protein